MSIAHDVAAVVGFAPGDGWPAGMAVRADRWGVFHRAGVMPNVWGRPDWFAVGPVAVPDPDKMFSCGRFLEGPSEPLASEPWSVRVCACVLAGPSELSEVSDADPRKVLEAWAGETPDEAQLARLVVEAVTFPRPGRPDVADAARVLLAERRPVLSRPRSSLASVAVVAAHVLSDRRGFPGHEIPGGQGLFSAVSQLNAAMSHTPVGAERTVLQTAWWDLLSSGASCAEAAAELWSGGRVPCRLSELAARRTELQMLAAGTERMLEAAVSSDGAVVVMAGPSLLSQDYSQSRWFQPVLSRAAVAGVPLGAGMLAVWCDTLTDFAIMQMMLPSKPDTLEELVSAPEKLKCPGAFRLGRLDPATGLSQAAGLVRDAVRLAVAGGCDDQRAVDAAVTLRL